MNENTDNTVTRTLIDCLASAGEGPVRQALEQAGIDPEAGVATVAPARIAKIIAPLLADRWERTLAEALPNLALQADFPFQVSALSTRARNVANDNGLMTAGALGNLSPSSLWSLRNAGRKTVNEFVRLAIQLHLQLEETPSQRVYGTEASPSEQLISPYSRDVSLEQPASSLNLSVRSQGCLNRLGIETLGALIQYSETELLATPNFGRTSLAEIRDRLSDLGLAFRRPNCIDATGYPRPRVGDRDGQVGSSSDGIAESMGALLVILAQWAAQIRESETLDEVLALGQSISTLPEDVQNAASRLLSNSLESFRIPDSQIQSLFDDLLDGLDDRARAIFEKRHLCTEKITLRDISRQYGMSRERVRQIARQTSASIQRKLVTPRFRHLRWRFHNVATTLGNGAPEPSVLVSQTLGIACRGVTASARTRALVLWASGPYHQRDGWLLRSGVQRPVIPLDKDAFGGEVELTVESVSGWLVSLGFPAQLALTVMGQSGTARKIGQKWVRWPRIVTDKAEVILRLLGRPADSVEIVELIGEDYSDVSLRNRLCGDDRFVRVNKRHFALAAWGLEEYSGITQEIIERIERDGDSTNLEALVAELVRQFDVSELSVRAYACAPMFVIEGGVIRRRGGSDKYPIDARIETAPGLFPNPDRGLVHMVIPVDADVRRNSGASVKEAVAAALGMKPGDRLAFTSDVDGIQVVLSWPESSVAGPYLGGARALLHAVERGAGDECILTFAPSHGSVSLRWIPNDDVEAADLTGLAIERGHELDAIANSLGCKRTAVRSILAARGDCRLLSLMPSYEDDPMLNDAFANLADVLGET